MRYGSVSVNERLHTTKWLMANPAALRQGESVVPQGDSPGQAQGGAASLSARRWSQKGKAKKIVPQKDCTGVVTDLESP
eukprot:CAMPEP_0174313628 /NCGR_PEP_ID=MMETSP0810-20121108/5110_1 /TAXON_ID=73025 ORGANISM="Eutreptiella gymnastica-like, Strain CCMP1594" /NCGR_SAMPLE_ID=MMETSP0810 /ASSEMBLY_ACC=CAM_ASM_000659 /LENGTH=78 /DNA_ID=CAMNT_0015422471 /DNA_START=1074 /DNA_END=1306 /DNA_ORIENTATION=-